MLVRLEWCCVCFLQKKLTDAVYYFVRSLAASNPFLNGREILQSIFEDVRKRVSTIMCSITISCNTM